MAAKAWEKVIDKLFITEKYKRRSEQNTENKAKQPYGSSHGCEPFAQKRYKEVKETGTGRERYVEGWYKIHYKEGRGWINMRARDDWELIKTEYDNMLEEAGGDEAQVDEVECLKRALGERRGHTRGVGRKVKNIPSYYAPSTSTSQQTINAMAQQLTQQITQQLSQQFNQQMQAILLQHQQNQPITPLQFNFDASQIHVQVPNNPLNEEYQESSSDSESSSDEF